MRGLWVGGMMVLTLVGCGPRESGDAGADGNDTVVAEGEACRSGEVPVVPADALGAAVAAMGSRPDGVLRFSSVERRVQDFQSDRHDPPFFSSFDVQEVRYDPATGAEHRSGEFVYPGMGPGPARESAVTDTAAYLIRAGEAVPVPAFFDGAADSRALNPWAVLEDWEAADDVVWAGECVFRDEWRTVLERAGPFGRDRLHLDRETGLPVGLSRTAPHATWGQRDVAFVWSTWLRLDGGRYFPSASFRTDDGRVTLERTVGRIGLVSGGTSALPALPPVPAMAPDPWLTRWSADAPDTVSVGEDVFLLAQRGYNEAVVASGDTVYLFDATVNEARARQDSTWIARLFPDRPHVALVVTDVAWPHIGGVRFWVARGATVYAHPVSAPLLEEVVARRWTRWPDALQQVRDGGRPAPLLIREVDTSTALAGGVIRLIPIGGLGSEGALMAWVPGVRFLWAGDYVQLVDRPTLYAEEVLRAAAREGIHPDRGAAQHLPLVGWDQVEGANPGVADAPTPGGDGGDAGSAAMPAGG